MVPLGQCIGHLVLREDASWRDPCAALGCLASHSHSIRQGGLGAEGSLGPWAQPSPIAYCPVAQSEAALRGQNSCSAGGQGRASQDSVPGWGEEGAGHLQTRLSSSDPCGLLNAVKADPGWGGGDGHGAGHPGADRVLVLPSVPPLPDGRADLWAQSRP